jgi:aspartyl protease family protein
MLRFAILVAAGACLLALLTPDLVSMFLPHDAGRPVSTASAPTKASSALSPATTSGAFAEASIEADNGGQYTTQVGINGIPVKMLVDTGATMVVISYETASRLGLQVFNSDFTGRVQTANGVAAVAPITLREVTIGSIYLGDVKALVAARDAGGINLLGMSFLRRLASVEQKSGKLHLRQ